MFQNKNLPILAGWAYLVIFVTGIFANFVVVEGLVVPGDAAATISNLTESNFMFRVGVLSFVIMVIADVVVAWALYLLFKNTDENLSLFAGWFRLVNAAIFGVALYHLVSVMNIIGGGLPIEKGSDILNALVMAGLGDFNITWLVGLVFFGVHLFALAGLILKSGIVPKFIGYLLLVAGVGYLVDSTAYFLMSDYLEYKEILSMIVIIPGVVGELSLTIWLIAKGKKLV
ncbi:MAG: DUF4386 domain-containing protein [Melioribacteraceae bacterium]|nr:MAG: DUF4386 domain-containing protein [Melioribacteraceae bacterium]